MKLPNATGNAPPPELRPQAARRIVLHDGTRLTTLKHAADLLADSGPALSAPRRDGMVSSLYPITSSRRCCAR